MTLVDALKGRDGLKALGFMTLGAAGATTAAFLGGDLPSSWVMNMTEKWGPGFLMVVLVMSGFMYYVPRSGPRDFIKSQQDQAVALNSLSKSFEQIAGQESKLDHIVLNQRVIADRLNGMQSHAGAMAGRLQGIEVRLRSIEDKLNGSQVSK